jgi:hypothetical protein
LQRSIKHTPQIYDGGETSTRGAPEDVPQASTGMRASAVQLRLSDVLRSGNGQRNQRACYDQFSSCDREFLTLVERARLAGDNLR